MWLTYILMGDWLEILWSTATVAVVAVVVVVVVLTLTRIMKTVITGQAPVTLEWENTPGKNTSQ